MRVIGIDIGKGGAVAYIDEDKYDAFDMPVYEIQKKKGSKSKKIDKTELLKLLKQLSSVQCRCIIERQRPFPREGVISSFSLGEQQGLIEGIVTALGIEYEYVIPQTWQKEIGIVKTFGEKFISYEKACSLFPKIELKTPRGRILDGRCDALLIAEFGRRRGFNGGQG